MDTEKLVKLNSLIAKSYECSTFVDFLKLAIFSLHEIIMYDSGMFFCAISKDSSFFKPYINGNIEEYYQKQRFKEQEGYLNKAIDNEIGNEAYVFTAKDYSSGLIKISQEPRNRLLIEQNEFHIACLRIVYKGQFLGEIYLHRDIHKAEFDEEDLFVLRLMQPHISLIFNNIHAKQAIESTESCNLPGTKKGMCILDNEMSIISGNVIGIEMLKATTVFGSSVLYHVKELCEDALNEKKIQYSSNLNTKFGNMRIDIFARQDSLSNKQFVVVMEFLGEEQIAADYKFKFSKRESEIIDGLIQGKNNTQLANLLNLSENTIKTHIKNIYKKTGVSNRTELAYLLMYNAG